MIEKKTLAEELALRAYLYVSGELTEAERAEFEQQLALEQPAREALAEAVRLSAALTGGVASPDPAYRERVRARLQPSWWQRLLARRSYHGHPLVWAAFGAAAALLVALTVLRPAPKVRVIVDRGERAQQQSDEPPDETLRYISMTWADLSTPEHVARTHAEKSLRESRAEERRQSRRAFQPGNQP
jgi:hypothetical protein